MAKKQRGGRIFLDYLRNDRMATAVAPLSPRAATGRAGVHAADLDAGESRSRPGRFTIRTAPALLRRTKAWADYDGSEGSLRDAIKRLGAAGGQGAARARRPSKRGDA